MTDKVGHWWFSANNWLKFSAGTFLGTGAWTMAALARPDSVNAQFTGAWRSTTSQNTLYLDTSHIYGPDDFSSGYGTLTTNGTQWYVIAISKVSGSAHYRCHYWPYASAGTGTMSHGESVGAGNHANYTNAATDLYIGRGYAPGNGLIAVTAAWDRALSDAELDTLKSSHLAAWYALTPQFLGSMQNWNGTTGAVDVMGNSTFTSLTGTIDSENIPITFDFSAGTLPPLSVWNGTAETIVDLAGVWDGSTIVPATATALTATAKAPPVLVASYLVGSSGPDTSTLTTPSFTPAVGELLVVKGSTADFPQLFSGVPTASGGGSPTFALRVINEAASRAPVYIWTAVTTAATSMTISSPAIGAASRHAICVERWTGAALAATPATTVALAVGPSVPSATIATVGVNSVVTWINGDWWAILPTGHAYLSGAVETGLYAITDATRYHAYQAATVPGVQTFGMSAPGGQSWTLAALELQAA